MCVLPRRSTFTLIVSNSCRMAWKIPCPAPFARNVHIPAVVYYAIVELPIEMFLGLLKEAENTCWPPANLRARCTLLIPPLERIFNRIGAFPTHQSLRALCTSSLLIGSLNRKILGLPVSGARNNRPPSINDLGSPAPLPLPARRTSCIMRRAKCSRVSYAGCAYGTPWQTHLASAPPACAFVTDPLVILT